MGHWYEHTYPLDADPLKDPTPIGNEGPYNTIGFENLWAKLWKDVAEKKARFASWASDEATHDFDPPLACVKIAESTSGTQE